MDTDTELSAVRELRVSVEPSEHAVSRARWRLVQAIEGDPSLRSRRSWWPAISAAAAAVVIIVGLAVVLAPGSGQPQQPPSAAQPAAQPAAPSAPTAPAVAVDFMATPVQLQPGELLLVRTTSTAYVHEMWLDVNGGIPMLIRRADTGQPAVTFDSDEGEAADRARLANEGPSLRLPTPAFLAALPTDPVALKELIVAQMHPAGNRLRDDLIFKETSGFLHSYQALLSPAVRATFVTVLSTLPGARVDDTIRAVAGHQVYTVEEQRSENVAGIYVDAATGQIVGLYAGVTGADPQSTADLPEYWVVSAEGQTP